MLHRRNRKIKPIFAVKEVRLLFGGMYQNYRVGVNGVFNITYAQTGIFRRCTVLWANGELIEVKALFPWHIQVLEWGEM